MADVGWPSVHLAPLLTNGDASEKPSSHEPIQHEVVTCDLFLACLSGGVHGRLHLLSTEPE